MHSFNLLYALPTIAVVMAVILGTFGFLTYLERKISAWMQDRYGPNRVGPRGLLQMVADGLKFLLKEDIIPNHVDKLLYLVAPIVAVTTALFAFAVVPFGATEPAPRPPAPLAAGASEQQIDAYQKKLDSFTIKEQQYRSSYQFVIAPGLSVGILFLFAIASLNVYAIILGGWSANSKYSLLGAIRSSAQVISYEIPMAMSVVGLFLLAGSLNLERIISQQVVGNSIEGGAQAHLIVQSIGAQALAPVAGPLASTTQLNIASKVSESDAFVLQRGGAWFVFVQPLAFLLFLTSSFAECNRLPFDLPEAEQELVGGYHTEYSAWKFAMFFIGEYAHMITASFLIVILFFGGWHMPWITGGTGLVAAPIKLAVMAAKVAFFLFFFIAIRWTIPRFRFDQLMGLAWKVMIPLALINLLSVMIVKQLGWNHWLLLPISLLALVAAGAVALLPSPRRNHRPPSVRFAGTDMLKTEN